MRSLSTIYEREPDATTADILRTVSLAPFPFAVCDGHGAILASTATFDARRATDDALRDLVARVPAALAERASSTSRSEIVLEADSQTRVVLSASVGSQLWTISVVDADCGTRDALTGLLNRAALREHLRACLSQPEAEGLAQTALLLLDLDRFKAVNDTLGHPIGDKLLCMVVQRISRVLGPDDVVARLGGDEFAVLVRNVADPRARAAALADRLVDLVGRSYLLGEHLVTIGLSVGIALPGDAGQDADRLLTLADLALYHAKEMGRGCFRFFDPALEERANQRRMMEQDLRRALALRQFEVFYQPLAAAVDGSILGCEALIRWRHPEHGMISPAVFVPIAEETGLIVQIGEWVLRTACREAAGWPQHMSIAVNLSPVQVLHPNLVTMVTQALAQSGLSANRLELEITEGVLLQDSASTLRTLHQLRALGIRIAMDDFGTGYSSLGYLRSFPFDKVKIDQSFVREMATSNDAAAIVRAVLGLGASLNMRVTAEGVETEEQADGLRAEGCEQLQGYLISRPIPADQLAVFLGTYGNRQE